MSPAATARPAPRSQQADTARTGYDPSLNCFFNALLHETDAGRLAQHTIGSAFVIELPTGAELCVPCRQASQTGRHALEGPCYRRGPQGDTRALTFPEAVEHALEALPIDDQARQRVLQRVLRSDRNLQDALQARRDELEELFAGELGFAQAEQALLAGHAMHPCPKDRGAWGRLEAEAWAPAHAASLPLRWVAAPRERTRAPTAGEATHEAIVHELAETDARLSEHRDTLASDEMLVPCHPFQLRHWRSDARLASAFADGSLRILPESSLAWQPTSSLRTLYHPQAAWMPKFSLSVRLTNSLRHLHPEELVRGPRFADVLATPEGRRLRSRFPRFHVLDEPVSLLLLDEAGEPIEETGLAWRCNPYVGEDARETEVLATLTQDDPRDGKPRLVQRLRQQGHGDEEGALGWFQAFLDVALGPLLQAHGDHGLLLGAHQQNLVLELDEAWPEAAGFRDCQGTGFSPLGQQRFAATLADWADGVALCFDQETANVLLAYYLVVNATFNVVASLARPGWVSEPQLVERLAAFLEQLDADGLEDPSLVRHLLQAPELHLKGNLHYAMRGIDETTQSCDVLALYRPIPNPIAEVR